MATKNKKIENYLSKYLTIKNHTMEAKKQANRTYLTPEQVKANLARAKHNWYLNKKDYYKPGGHDYECLTRVLTCFVVERLKRSNLGDMREQSYTKGACKLCKL